MTLRKFVPLAVLCGTVAITGWGAAGLGGLSSLGVENDSGNPEATLGTTLGAASLSDDAQRAAALPLLNTLSSASAAATSDASLPESAVTIGEAAVADPQSPENAFVPTVVLPESRSAPQPEKRVQLATLSSLKELQEYPKPAVRPSETPNECLVPEICIDEYLWSLYERTPKIDTNKVTEKIKTTVKTKDKTRTVTKSIIKYVVGDFTWKDPIAAGRAGMALKDYVIGGLDRGFKLKLYHALRAMDDAGLMPGITSAFRDDYRQSIASGNRAASDSSYHGGSRRGGYGHALAVDLVSIKGATRAERYASSEKLWQWIDAHEQQLGVGRPYLDRDPPHVAPIDGKEYADKRGPAKALLAGLKRPSPSLNAK